MIRSLVVLASITLTACVGSFGLANAADVQQLASPRRIGVLLVGTSPERKEVQEFRDGLQDEGYTEGRDVLIEWRSANGNLAQIPQLVTELIQSKPELIVVEST